MLTLKFNKFLVTSIAALAIISLCIYFYSCKGSTEPEIDLYEGFLGQISSDFGTSIIKPDGSVWNWNPLINIDTNNTDPFYCSILSKIKNIKNAITVDLFISTAVVGDIEGNIWYWGMNLASSMMEPLITEPIIIGNLKDLKSLNNLGNKINLLRKDGTVWRITINKPEPNKSSQAVQLSGMWGIKSISETLALKEDGTLCEFEHTEPIYGGLIPGINDVIDFENVWNRRTVILKTDGTVWAWGQNSMGELGNGNFENSIIPTQVKNLTDIVDISANADFNLALKRDGTVWFWGFAGRDQNNKLFGYSTPIKIENLNNVVLLDAGYVCHFMKNDKTYWYYNVNSKKLAEISFEK